MAQAKAQAKLIVRTPISHTLKSGQSVLLKPGDPVPAELTEAQLERLERLGAIGPKRGRPKKG